MKNVTTFGKLIGLLLFCLPLSFLLTHKKTTRNELARPVMGTICLALLRASERSEHIVVLSLRFLSIVTKILCKIRATTFTEKLRKITRMGERLG